MGKQDSKCLKTDDRQMAAILFLALRNIERNTFEYLAIEHVAINLDLREATKSKES